MDETLAVPPVLSAGVDVGKEPMKSVKDEDSIREPDAFNTG